MRNAAGELADSFHFFGLPDPILGRDLVREIAHEAVEYKSVAGLQRRDAQLRSEFTSVAPSGLDLAAGPCHPFEPGLQKVSQGRLDRSPGPIRGDQLENVLSEHVRPWPSENCLRLRNSVPDDGAVVR